MTDDNVFYDDTPPPKSSNAKVVLWVFGICALCFVVCCGGAGVVAWRFGDAAKKFVTDLTTTDPDEIRRQTAAMVDIDIPDEYQPMQGMNMVAVRMVMYQTPATQDGSQGMLMLMEMAMQQFGANAKQQEQELRKSMKQQHANQGYTSSKSETREIEIRGEKVPFEFVEGTNAGTPGQEKKTHMITGVFRGKRGPVMLQLMIPDEDYDEDAVMKMLQSIK